MSKLIITSSESGIIYEKNHFKNNKEINNINNMKSIFEDILLKAIKDGELKHIVLDEINHNISSHKRVIESIEAQKLKLDVHLDAINNDIKSLMYQKEIILGEDND